MSKKCVFYSGFADERYLHWEWLKSIWHHNWATRWWFWGSVALLVKLSNFSDQELSNSYSFSRNDPTISSALFVSSIPPNCWAQSFPDQILSYKEKLTFRLVGKIIFRTRAIWVGIFWQKMEWKKKKTFDTPPLLPDTIFLPTLHGCLYLWKNPWRPLQLKVCSAQKASVCISSNFMFWHMVWKSQKKSNSTLRAKRAYILSVQKFIKTGQFGKFLKTTVLPDK